MADLRATLLPGHVVPQVPRLRRRAPRRLRRRQRLPGGRNPGGPHFRKPARSPPLQRPGRGRRRRAHVLPRAQRAVRVRGRLLVRVMRSVRVGVFPISSGIRSAAGRLPAGERRGRRGHESGGRLLVGGIRAGPPRRIACPGPPVACVCTSGLLHSRVPCLMPARSSRLHLMQVARARGARSRTSCGPHGSRFRMCRVSSRARCACPPVIRRSRCRRGLRACRACAARPGAQTSSPWLCGGVARRACKRPGSQIPAAFGLARSVISGTVCRQHQE